MNNPFYMSCFDIYLSHMNPISPLGYSKPEMDFSKLKVMPLMSWDIFMMGYQQKIVESQKRVEMASVLSLAKKYGWKNDLHTAFDDHDYEALVITDKSQNIIWVNNGFTLMTGYSKTFALNQTPRFLQGPKTCNATKRRIRQHIDREQPFKAIVLNYKKDGTPYKCEVSVIPLYNDYTTHYMAFEKQVV